MDIFFSSHSGNGAVGGSGDHLPQEFLPHIAPACAVHKFHQLGGGYVTPFVQVKLAWRNSVMGTVPTKMKTPSVASSVTAPVLRFLLTTAWTMPSPLISSRTEFQTKWIFSLAKPFPE